MGITRLNHAVLYVRDAEKSADFYSEVLGLLLARASGRLEERGARVLQTRPDTAAVGLGQRPLQATEEGVHLLVSVHFDAFGDGVNPFENHGTHVFYNQAQSLDLARAVQRELLSELGLRDLGKTANYGLKALMEVSDCRSDMTSYHIGFRIAPRINAAGRMDIARHVVELFESKDFNEARRLAKVLDDRNRERQQIQARITELALTEAADSGDKMFVVVAGEGWHRGVIGLAASRLAEKLCRPVVVFSIENGVAHGSGRSRPGFHLVDAASKWLR